jgi:hypothetical protein
MTQHRSLSAAQLVELTGKLAAAPQVRRLRAETTRTARTVLGQALAGASADARARFSRLLQIAGLAGTREDQVPQTPWPAFEPAVPGGPPRIAELLPTEARRTLARAGMAMSMTGPGPIPTQMNTDPDVVEKEQGTETQNYRAARRQVWQAIIASRNAYREQAKKHGADPGAAIAASDKAIRGDVRIFVMETLTHVSAAAAADFFERAPRTWGTTTEVLLDEGQLVPTLIDRSYPHAQWAKDIDVLTRAVAEDDASWKAYALAGAATLGEAAKTAAATGFEVLGDLGKGTGDLLSGGGDLLGGLGQGLGRLPIALGIVAVGAVTVALVVGRSSSTPAPAGGAT